MLRAGGYVNGKTNPHQMPNTFHVCKWICFAISKFAIIKEICSFSEEEKKMKNLHSSYIFSLKFIQTRSGIYSNQQLQTIKDLS